MQHVSNTNKEANWKSNSDCLSLQFYLNCHSFRKNEYYTSKKNPILVLKIDYCASARR